VIKKLMASQSQADDIEERVIHFVRDVLETILEVYQTCDESTRDYLLELSEIALYFFVLVISNAVTTPAFSSLRLLVQLMTQDTESRGLRKGGRPRVPLGKNQLEYLIEQGFRINDISNMFTCSRKTVERRINEYGLSSVRYTIMDEQELDRIVRDITVLFPQCGEKTVSGRLRARGIRIQREKIRASLHRVDPSGIVSRCRSVLHRRVYSVESANALWHIDGYHKLIRWRLVIHGGIDGFSCLIVFLKAAANNRAETVLNAYLGAIDEYGLPLRVRMDHGGENIKVAEFMLEHPARGSQRHSVITGRSTHNQRIERLWRDLFNGCISFFYYFFYYLEELNLLDVTDPLDLYALHFVFLPVIQNHLDMFRTGWAHHKVRTEGNRSPQQLWILGFHSIAEADDDVLSGLDFDWQSYGIDWEGPVPTDDENIVVVPEDPDMLTDSQKLELKDLLSDVDTDLFSRQEMITQLAIAKSFVHLHGA
jgi:hypothetical protein